MSNLLECEACPNQVTEGRLSTVQTNKGPMKLCPACVASHAFGKVLLQSATVLDTAAAQCPMCEGLGKFYKESQGDNLILDEVSCDECNGTGKVSSNASLALGNENVQQNAHHWPIQAPSITNPQSVTEPSTGKKMKQSELFTLAVQNANVKINEFDYSADGYKQLEAWIEKLESIVFEAKTMAGVGHSKKRELDAKSGKNRWDKERANRPSSTGNLSDPREKNTFNRKKDSHAKSLSKLETIVKGLIDLGYSDDEIMEQCPEGKFKGHEVREAIGKMKA